MIKKILVLVLLIGGLVVAYFLAKNSQELRRSASGEKVSLNFSPSVSLSNVGVGSTFRLVVTGNVEGGPGFGVVHLQFRYDQTKLELLNNDEGSPNVRMNTAFGPGLKQLDGTVPGQLNILATIGQSTPQITGVMSAENPFMSILFRVKQLGTASVSFPTGEAYTIAGTDAGGGSVTYAWQKVGGGQATENLVLATAAPPATATSVPGATATSVPPTATATSVPAATPTGVNNSCTTTNDCGWCNGACMKSNTATYTACSNRNPVSGYECVCSSGNECNARLITTNTPTAPAATATSVPVATPTLPDTSDNTISFKVALAGVKTYSKCLGEPKVAVLLLKGGNKEQYKDVSLVDTNTYNSRNEKVFLVDRLSIASFDEREDVAVFIKGSKHLQMKFGVDNQEENYNQQGGQIDIDSRTVFDFSKYSLLAGDVNQDGFVNGIDFSEIKKRAAVYEKITEGSDSQFDLDGSCIVNNIDVVLLVQALNEKYDQMY